jgi:hypothetical protein
VEDKVISCIAAIVSYFPFKNEKERTKIQNKELYLASKFANNNMTSSQSLALPCSRTFSYFIGFPMLTYSHSPTKSTNC